MAATTGKSNGTNIRLPSSLSLRDLLAIVGVAITMMAAWGLFSSRITLIERELVALQQAEVDSELALDKLRTQVTRSMAHQHEDEILIDQLFLILKKPVPTRRAAN